MSRGKLFAIEGGDANGKKTQTSRLVGRLTRWWDARELERPALNGPAPRYYSFPRYETPLGQSILRHLKRSIAVMEPHTVSSSDHNIDGDTVHRRAPEDLLVFQCMMTADRYEAAVEMEHLLARGCNVVCDRWWQSGYAYGVYDKLDPTWLLNVHEALPQADVNFFLDVPPDVALARRPEVRDRHEASMDRRRGVVDIYRRLWWEGNVREPGRWVTIDGDKHPDDVEKDIWGHVEDLLMRSVQE